jgi:peptidoglycan/xylan/chitin deacetylase (PgdA/CDA1 family)
MIMPRNYYCLALACIVGLYLLLFSMPTIATEKMAMQRSIAITIDDLPWQSLGDNDPFLESSSDNSKQIYSHHKKLTRAMKQAKAPAIGFVNEGKLFRQEALQTERLAMLDDWLSSGFELGNHTYGHVSMHDVSMAAYQADILKGERQLRPLLAKYKQTPKWFRHPYLRAGQTAEAKQTLTDFLAQHSYRIAPVTHDNSEWIWAFAYRRELRGGKDKAVLAKLRQDYVPYMMARLDYYEQQSIALLGYNLPHIMLIHANELNAVAYGDLIKAIRKRGYRIVTLEKAMQDPAYLRKDGYTGKYGPSWIHRWAIAENKPRGFYGDEPKTPEWVMKLAQIDSE